MAAMLEITHSSAAEQVKHAQKLIALKEPAQRRHIYPWHGDVGNKAKNDQDAKGEEQLASQVRLPEGIHHRLDQAWSSLPLRLNHLDLLYPSPRRLDLSFGALRELVCPYH